MLNIQINSQVLLKMPNVRHMSYFQSSGEKRIQNYLFRFSDVLGKGNFSTVYKGINVTTMDTVAIKYIALQSLTCQRLRELLDQQIQILTSVNHPNIVKCHEVLKSFSNCYIITELCDQGDLQTLLNRKIILNEAQATPYIRDIYQGLHYLEKQKITHRDIKIANIFISKGKAKIADFGFAQKYTKEFNDGKIGTPLCMSPEGVLQNLYGQKTDVWSFGILMYQLTHGKLPMSHCTNQPMLKEQVLIQMKMDQLNPKLSLDLRQLILKCLNVNPCTRITFQEMRDCAFIQRITKNRLDFYSVKNIRIPAYQRRSIRQGDKYVVSLKNIDTIQLSQKTSILLQQLKKKSNSYLSSKCVEIKRDTEKEFFKSGKQTKVGSSSHISQAERIQIKSKKTLQKMEPVISELAAQQINDRNTLEQKSEKSESTLSAGNQSTNSLKDNLFMQSNQTNSLPNTSQLQSSFMSVPFNRGHETSFQKTSKAQDQNKWNNNITFPQISVNIDLKPVAKHCQKQLKVATKFHGQSIQCLTPGIKLNSSLLKGTIKYDQMVGLIHLCRLVYKYICELKRTAVYHSGDLNLKYYSNYVLNLLNQMDSKILSKTVILQKSQSNQSENEIKLEKMRNVIQDYVRRYKPNLQIERAQYLNRNTIQIKQLIEIDSRFIDNFYIPDKTKISELNSSVLKFMKILQQGSRFQKYTEFDQNQELENMCSATRRSSIVNNLKRLQLNQPNQ